MQSDLSAFILAGGKSSRMGTDKAFLVLHEMTLLDRALAFARAVTPQVHIVGEPAKFAVFAPSIADTFPGCGPLAGIHAALCLSPSNLNLVLAVDLPFITGPLLEFIVNRSAKSDTVVTVPRVDQRLQPLCAVYRRSFASPAEHALRSGQYKIDSLFEACGALVLDEKELVAAGFAPDLFRNLNTPEDVAAARSKEPLSRFGPTTDR